MPDDREYLCTMYIYECVDKDAESVPGSATNTNGALFYPVEASWNGMACPPCDAQKNFSVSYAHNYTSR